MGSNVLQWTGVTATAVYLMMVSVVSFFSVTDMRLTDGR